MSEKDRYDLPPTINHVPCEDYYDYRASQSAHVQGEVSYHLPSELAYQRDLAPEPVKRLPQERIEITLYRAQSISSIRHRR